MFDEFVKKVNTIDSDKQNLKKILKILIKRHLIPVNLLWPIQDFNRLAKINFNARMLDASKNLATKIQLENPFDLGDKNREKIKKLQNFDLSLI